MFMDISGNVFPVRRKLRLTPGLIENGHRKGGCIQPIGIRGFHAARNKIRITFQQRLHYAIDNLRIVERAVRG